jgi:hypothetical protein
VLIVPVLLVKTLARLMVGNWKTAEPFAIPVAVPIFGGTLSVRSIANGTRW